MNFTLTTLGTASARPVVGQHQSAHVFNVHGRLFLVDCGENAQMQLKRYGISKAKIANILISHLHGDHVFGIFGMLSTMALDGRTAPLYIYAPRDFSSVLNFFLSHFGEGVKFEIHHIPLTMKTIELIAEFRSCQVYAFPLNHRIDCYGFKIRYDRKNTVQTAAYCFDTAPRPELVQWLEGTDLLFHEATFADEHEELAERMYHSTARQAASLAAAARVQKLILGHFSTRYKDLNLLLEQAREVFPESYLAEEGMNFDVPLTANNSNEDE